MSLRRSGFVYFESGEINGSIVAGMRGQQASYVVDFLNENGTGTSGIRWNRHFSKTPRFRRLARHPTDCASV
jgi:GDP-D-mannose dehydratase